MTRAEFYRLRRLARSAILRRDMLSHDPHATWQDRQRAQQWVQTCVGDLPGYAYARPYSFIELQSRHCMFQQFPQWLPRRLHFLQRRQQEDVRRLITDTVAPLGPSVLDLNVAAAEARKVVAAELRRDWA